MNHSPPKATVAMCFSAIDQVMTDTMLSVIKLVKLSQAQGITLEFACSRSSHNAGNSNAMIQTCLDGKRNGTPITHLLFVDTDMVFPADALVRLLAHQKDFVGVTYRTRMEPHWLLYKALDGSKGSVHPAGDGLQQVRGLPFGLTLIKMEVLENMAPPWFEWVALGGTDFRSPDYVFCENAQAAGYALWLDWELSKEAGHIAQKVITL